MALGDPYATLEELKTLISLPEDDVLDDMALTYALETASREIEQHCGRQFNKAAEATPRTYVARAGVLHVDDFCSTDDLAFATASGDGTFPTPTPWTAASFTLEPRNGVVDGTAGWPYSRIVGSYSASEVQVTARWGWNTVPAPVKQACLVMAEEVAKLKDAPFGVAGYADYGPIRIRNNPFAIRMLAPYRLRPVKVG